MIKESELVCFWRKIDSIKYVVLRNYDNILEDINCGGDIDILVEDKVEFVKLTNAIALRQTEDNYNYEVVVGQEKVPIDIREVGDGYYDKAWEIDMLKERVKKGSYYIIEGEQYIFSLLYHCIIHKKEIVDKYYSFMKMHGINDKKQLIRELDKYMNKRKYKYVVPKDDGVEFNKYMYYRRKIKNWSKGN